MTYNITIIIKNKLILAFYSLFFVILYIMKTYIDIASTEIISDDAWLEGLRQYGMIPRSEAEKMEEPLKIAGSKINKQGNKVCANYDLSFVSPNDSSK